jgi:hypothetical protein
MHKNHLVCISVFKEIVADGFAWRGQGNVQVIIDKDSLFALYIIVFRLHVKSFKALMAEETLEGDFGFTRKRFPNRFYQCRGVAMVYQGVNTRKPVGGDELF